MRRPRLRRDNPPVTVTEGQTATNTGTWSDANAGNTVTLSASVGTVIKSGTNAGGTWSWSFATTDGPDQSRTVTITANDAAGGVTTTMFSLVVNNVAPTVVVTGDGSADEGQTKTYTYTVVDAGADTSLVTESCGANATYIHTEAASSFDCTFIEGPGSSVVTVTANDGDASNNVGTGTVNVTVANVAPTATFNAPSSVAEGSPIALSLTGASDPSTVDTAAGFSYAFDCGAGYGGFGSSSTASCPTTDNGSRTVKGKIRDEDGGVNEYTATVTVTNVVPTITISGAANVNEGSPYSLTLGAISDPGADTVTSWIVHWGDGSSDTYTADGVVTHTYADGPDGHDITVDLTDEDGLHLDAPTTWASPSTTWRPSSPRPATRAAARACRPPSASAASPTRAPMRRGT